MSKRKKQIPLALTELEINLANIVLRTHLHYVQADQIQKRCIQIALDKKELEALDGRNVIFEREIGGRFSGLVRKQKQLAALALVEYFIAEHEIKDTTKALANALTKTLMNVSLDSVLVNEKFATKQQIKKNDTRKLNPMLRKIAGGYTHKTLRAAADDAEKYTAALEQARLFLRAHIKKLMQKTQVELEQMVEQIDERAANPNLETNKNSSKKRL